MPGSGSNTRISIRLCKINSNASLTYSASRRMIPFRESSSRNSANLLATRVVAMFFRKRASCCSVTRKNSLWPVFISTSPRRTADTEATYPRESLVTTDARMYSGSWALRRSNARRSLWSNARIHPYRKKPRIGTSFIHCACGLHLIRIMTYSLLLQCATTTKPIALRLRAIDCRAARRNRIKWKFCRQYELDIKS